MRYVSKFINFLLTVTLRSWWGVAGYTAAITIGAIISAVAILYAMPGDEPLLHYQRALIIAATTAPPFGVFGGWHLMRISSLSDKLSQLVARDRLTDVASRDFFFSELASSPNRRGVVMMLDIDRFKQVNDTYGHLVGDKIVVHVAAILQMETRATDIVCRFGGDEFVLFLDRLAPSEAHEIGERIRQRIVNSKIEVQGIEERISATVSIGVSASAVAEKIEQAISDADQAMYRAKQLGRNCVAVDGAVKGQATHK